MLLSQRLTYPMKANHLRKVVARHSFGVAVALKNAMRQELALPSRTILSTKLTSLLKCVNDQLMTLQLLLRHKHCITIINAYGAWRLQMPPGGKDHQIWNGVIWKHGVHKCNSKGLKQWHLIDYINTRKQDRHHIRVTKAMCGTECWTDHCLIIPKLNICFQPK